MALSFRIVCSAIWTVVALIYLTSGAPAAIKPAAHKASSTGTSQCFVFDYIVLPMYEVDGEVANQKSDNLTIPLEVCYMTNAKTAAPLCQEADELLRNISTCSPEVEMLEAVEEFIHAEKSNSIVIALQTDICHGFVDKRNNFASSSFAQKLTDPVVCSLICQKAMKKACTFLLWAYQVQATIHAIWEEIVSNKPSDVKVEIATEKNVNVNEENPSKESGSANEGNAEVSDSANEGNAEVNDSVKDENLVKTGGGVSSIEKEKSSGSITGGSKPTEAGLQTSAKGVVSLNSDSELNDGIEKLPSTAEVSKPVVSASEQTKSKPGEITGAHKVSNSLPISNQQVNADRGKANTVSETTVTTSATAAKKSKSGLQSDQNDPQPTEGNQEESGKQNKESTEKSEEHKSSAENIDGILKQTVTILPVENNEKEDGNVKEVPKMGEENGISKNSPSPQKNTGKVSSTVSGKHSESTMSDDVSNVHQEAKDGGKNSKASKIPAGDSITNIDSPKNEENPVDDISGTNHDDVDDNKPEVHDNTSDEVPASDKGTEGDTGGEGSSVEIHSTGNSYSVGDLNEGTSYIDNGIGEGGIELNEDSEDGIGLNDDTDMKVEKVKGDDDDGDSDQSQIAAGDTENDDRSNVQSPGQQTNVLNNKAGRVLEDSPIIPFPEQEDTHFFFYFVTIIVFAIGGYVLFHNKQKIFALIIEGRHERRRRSGASYRKLETK